MKFYLLVSLLIVETFAASRLYEMQKFDNCQVSHAIQMRLFVNNGSAVPDKIAFGGYLEVTEKILGPIEFTLDSNRCDFAMKKCEKFSIMKIPGVCDIINSKNGMIEDLLKTFEPRIQCPIMPGNYTAKDSVLDLAVVSGFPTNGFVWVETIKGVSGDGKNRKLVFCANVEAKITSVRDKKRKN
ncbi:hypothetical protein ACKWTF_003789 [Chironomus riparius]